MGCMFLVRFDISNFEIFFFFFKLNPFLIPFAFHLLSKDAQSKRFLRSNEFSLSLKGLQFPSSSRYYNQIQSELLAYIVLYLIYEGILRRFEMTSRNESKTFRDSSLVVIEGDLIRHRSDNSCFDQWRWSRIIDSSTFRGNWQISHC